MFKPHSRFHKLFFLALFFFSSSTLALVAQLNTVASLDNVDTKNAGDYLLLKDFNSVVNTLRGIYNDDGKIGIGKDPESNLDVAGKISSDTLSVNKLCLSDGCFDSLEELAKKLGVNSNTGNVGESDLEKMLASHNARTLQEDHDLAKQQPFCKNKKVSIFDLGQGFSYDFRTYARGNENGSTDHLKNQHLMNPDEVFIYKFTTDKDQSARFSTVEYIDGVVTRTIAVSTNPCDVQESVQKGLTASGIFASLTTGVKPFSIQGTTPLEPQTTYYATLLYTSDPQGSPDQNTCLNDAFVPGKCGHSISISLIHNDPLKRPNNAEQSADPLIPGAICNGRGVDFVQNCTIPFYGN